MSTAFGILLFVIVYGPVAYLVYVEVTGRRLRIRSLVARRGRLQRWRQRLELVSGYLRQS